MFLSDTSDVKGKTKNSVKAGRLCHLIYVLYIYSIPTLLVGKGGDNVNFYELLMYLITLIVLIIITKK